MNNRNKYCYGGSDTDMILNRSTVITVHVKYELHEKIMYMYIKVYIRIHVHVHVLIVEDYTCTSAATYMYMYNEVFTQRWNGLTTIRICNIYITYPYNTAQNKGYICNLFLQKQKKQVVALEDKNWKFNLETDLSLSQEKWTDFLKLRCT